MSSPVEHSTAGSGRRVAVMIGLDWPVGHHHQVFAGIQRYAREVGRWQTLINPYADLLFDQPGGPGVAGIVARATPELARRARAAGVPVVNVWLNSAAEGLPTVVADVAEAGRLAARHLLARGVRTFGFLGFTDNLGSRLQVEGFREIITARGLACSERFVPQHYDHTPQDWQRFQALVQEWIAQWPAGIGVLVANDLVCRYLAEACRERNLAIPHTVALVGAGNEVLVDTAADPSLSSIDFGYERVGYRAAELLDELMGGAPEPRGPVRLPPASLIARQSSDAFAVDDVLVAAALRFIADHLHEDIDVEQVARHAATTRRTLSRRFHDRLGMTIHAAITQRRLDRAKQRLVESDVVLKSIATECGFRDAIHLCKVFQRSVGRSPSDYRAERRVAP